MAKKRNPLNPNHQTKPRQSFIDYDYVNKLSKKDRAFLSKFTDEYYGGVFSEDDSKNLIQGEDNHRAIWREDSYRRICQFNIAQASKVLLPEELLNRVSENETFTLEEILAIVEKRMQLVSKDQVRDLLQQIKDFYNTAD